MAIGKVVGYARVSTADQNTDRQIASIIEFAEHRYQEKPHMVYTDRASGSNTHRPKFEELNRFVREDDVIIIHSPDRLARSTKDLLEVLQNWRERGVTVHFVTQPGLDQMDATGRLVLSILASIAEFERELTRERQREGIEIAKKKNKYKPTRKLTPREGGEIREKAAAGVKRGRLAEDYGVSGSTIYNVTRRRGIYGTDEYVSLASI